MHCLNLIAAAGLLTARAAQAAPRVLSFDASDASQYDGAYTNVAESDDSFPAAMPRGMGSAARRTQAHAACPAPVRFAATVTVDVTVYVTPTPTVVYVPCPEDAQRVDVSLPECEDEGEAVSADQRGKNAKVTENAPIPTVTFAPEATECEEGSTWMPATATAPA